MYKLTVSSVEFESAERIKIEPLNGLPFSSLPNTAYTPDSQRGRDLVSKIVASYEDNKREANVVESLKAEIEAFFSNPTKTVHLIGASQNNGIQLTATCDPITDWEIKAITGRSNYTEHRSWVSCSANFINRYSFHNVAINAGQSRSIGFSVAVYEHPDRGLSATLSEWVFCQGNDGGAFCSNEKWHGNNLKWFNWTGSEFRKNSRSDAYFSVR